MVLLQEQQLSLSKNTKKFKNPQHRNDIPKIDVNNINISPPFTSYETINVLIILDSIFIILCIVEQGY